MISLSSRGAEGLGSAADLEDPARSGPVERMSAPAEFHRSGVVVHHQDFCAPSGLGCEPEAALDPAALERRGRVRAVPASAGTFGATYGSMVLRGHANILVVRGFEDIGPPERKRCHESPAVSGIPTCLWEREESPRRGVAGIRRSEALCQLEFLRSTVTETDRPFVDVMCLLPDYLAEHEYLDCAATRSSAQRSPAAITEDRVRRGCAPVYLTIERAHRVLCHLRMLRWRPTVLGLRLQRSDPEDRGQTVRSSLYNFDP